MFSKMKKKMLLFVGLLMLVLALTGCQEQKDALIVGTNAAFPPFEFTTDDGNYSGFDIELIKAMGKEMKREVEIVNTAWEGLLPGLQNGNYDLVIAGMTITEERKKSVNFSDPYFEAGQVVVVMDENNSIKGSNDLAGKVVSVQIGTTGQFAAEKVEGIKEIKKFAGTPEAFQELLNGACDALVTDIGVAALLVKEHPETKIVGEPFTVEYYGIAIKKGNEKLLEEINSALKKIKENGTYDKIYDKWFSN